MFESDRDGNFELYSMNYDGTNLVRLTSNQGIDAHPCYSFDGKFIVYSSERNGKFDIFMIPAEGGEPVQITKHAGINMVPCFAPDGKSVLYESDLDGNFEIYSIGIDGSNRNQLTFTANPVQNFGPKYSHDGLWIAFASSREGENDKTNDIFLITPAGTNLTQLTFGMNNAESRSWAPNGNKIVFNSVVDGVGQLFVVELKTKKVIQLTHSEGNPNPFSPGGVFPIIKGEVTPNWTPDGKKIVFATDRNKRYAIYQMNPDGTNVEQITNSDFFSMSPNCQPINP